MARRPKRKLWIGAACLLVGGITLNALRIEAHGFHNLFSYTYWHNRSLGIDLYSVENHVLKRGNRNRKEVCLTFDDGPHPASARQILDVLDREHVHATFFLVGKRIKEHPEIAREILDRGNEVGNHSMTHPRLDTLSESAITKELVDCATTFEEATGSKMYLLRPPGMRFNDAVFNVSKRLDYTVIGWTTAAKDFTAIAPDLVEERVLDNIENGSIILLHDCPSTAAALPAILDEIHRRGFAIVTATQMLHDLPSPVTVRSNARSPHHVASLARW